MARVDRGTTEGIVNSHIRIIPPVEPNSVLSQSALEFVTSLHGYYNERRVQLLERRKKIQERIRKGHLPDFLPETVHVRESKWKIDSVPEDLQYRRVEITGPTDRKMVINALNSGADVYMADFEDSHSPIWTNTVQGQVNLQDAVNHTIEYTNPEGKPYRLNKKIATLIVRPRGFHLEEKHVLINNEAVPASFFDYGIYLYNNHEKLHENGTGPYFYLPKLENHVEARLWNNIFDTSEELLGLPKNTIKCSVLIENILAAFEMDEILYELKDHITALNFGRWDYIFSFIKKLGGKQDFVFPERAQLGMTTHFLTSCALLLVQTAHKRGAYAIGGMSANIPVKNNPETQEKALGKVIRDKEREAEQGFDGAWVAHPGLVPLVMEIFQKRLNGKANQLEITNDKVKISSRDILFVPKGTITMNGLQNNISVSLQYLSNWLNGNGCVAINNLMEDAATVEISRAQIWQWIYNESILNDETRITPELFRTILQNEKQKLTESNLVPIEKLDHASRLLDRLATSYEFTDFMTLPAYEMLD